MLRRARSLFPEPAPDVDTAFYFLSRITVERGRGPGMSASRKRLFVALSHNAADPAGYFHLPVERTVAMGSRIEL